MAYRTDVNARDKGGAILAVAAVHAALLFALLNLSGKIKLADPQSALQDHQFVDQSSAATARGCVASSRSPRRRKAARAEEHQEPGDAGRRAQAEDRNVPVQQIAASETPRQGTAPTQGASNVRGPGTGAGGAGMARAAAAGGNGPGGGGDDGVAEPPHLVNAGAHADATFPRT